MVDQFDADVPDAPIARNAGARDRATSSRSSSRPALKAAARAVAWGLITIPLQLLIVVALLTQS